MMFHVTYRDRWGHVQTGRVGIAPKAGQTPSRHREQAITSAAWRYNVKRSDVIGCVRVNPPQSEKPASQG